MNIETAEKIRAEYASRHDMPVTQSELAKKYNCPQSTISKVISHKLYGDESKKPRKPYKDSQSKEDKLLAAGLVKMTLWVRSADAEEVRQYDKKNHVLLSPKEMKALQETAQRKIIYGSPIINTGRTKPKEQAL